jgi:two-component system response regulator DevR
VIRVLIVDDHAIVRRGLAEVLGEEDDIEIVSAAAGADEALRVLDYAAVDVVVVDLRLGKDSGIDLCREGRARHPSVRFLVFTALSSEEALVEAMIAGATGYVLKTAGSSEICDAVRAVARGEHLLDAGATHALVERARRSGRRKGAAALTDQEQKVLYLLGRGLTNREISETLFLAPQTVKNYVSSILAKLGLRSRTQAALFSSSRYRDRDTAAGL